MDISKFLQFKFPEAEISFSGEDCSSQLLIVSEQIDNLKKTQISFRGTKRAFSNRRIARIKPNY